MSKGSSWERELCVTFSEWWSRGDRSDIFWRTAGSGARATARSKKGKTTFGQHGDICAIDPVGQPLIDTLCIEAKKGYGRFTLADLLDRPERCKLARFELWINKLETTYKAAGRQSWMLVVRRDRRVAVAYLPLTFFDRLVDQGAFKYKVDQIHPFLMLRANVEGKSVEVMGIHLDDFLSGVSPDHIIALSEKGKRNAG